MQFFPLTKENIGRTITKVRTARNVSQGCLAKTTGITQGYLSRIETGSRMPSFAVLNRIARRLDLPTEALILLATDPAYFSIQSGGSGEALGVLTKFIVKMYRLES